MSKLNSVLKTNCFLQQMLPGTLAMINSASSGLPSWSLSAMSTSDIREYDRLIMRTPVLITLWCRRTIRVYVPSAENLSEYVVSVWLKLFRLPVRTAGHNHWQQKIIKSTSITNWLWWLCWTSEPCAITPCITLQTIQIKLNNDNSNNRM